MAGFGNNFDRYSSRWDFHTWSLTLGALFDVRIRVHLLFFIFVLGQALQGYQLAGFSYVGQFVLPLTLFFFGIVLLHEYGHCFGCRSVGGIAEDILIWPLGGLAMVAPPHRPGAHLVTTLAGPAVNVALLILMTPLMFVIDGVILGALFNPFELGISFFNPSLAFYTVLFFKVNYWLLLFNMLPFFPFDGGQTLRNLLWYRIGYYEATKISCVIGMVGAAIFLLIAVYHQQLMIGLIGGFGMLICYQTRRETEMMGEMPENEFGYDFSQGYTSLEKSMGQNAPKKPKGPSLRERFRKWSASRRQKNDQQLEVDLDRILVKIQETGMDSLTRNEKRILNQASKKRRSV